MIDSRAWVAWLISALAVVFIANHPAVDLITIAAAALVARTAGRRSPFRLLLVLSLAFLSVRVVLFAITGHTGDTVLFEVPSVQLPSLLGGTTLGGIVTAEVVLTSLVEGLRIVSVVACFGAFLSVVETAEVMRLLPRFLFEAGLVVSIGLTFAPHAARSAREIREAQAMRGARRSIAPVVVPILATALEQSISLAESMDSRGYGRSTTDESIEERLRLIAAVAALAGVASISLWSLGRYETVTGLLAFWSLVALSASLWALSRRTPRTRYRKRPLVRADRAVILAGGLVASGVAIQSSVVGGIPFNAYESLSLSPPSLIIVLAAVAAAFPALSKTVVRR